jgi:O-antigen/teichoic acid export membrane protein
VAAGAAPLAAASAGSWMDTVQATRQPPRLAWSAAWRITSRIVSSVALGATLLLLARISPVGSYGEFAVAGAVTTIAGTVFGFGAPSRVLRIAAEDHSMRRRDRLEPVSLIRGLYLLHLGINLALVAVMLIGAAVLGFPATVAAGIVWGTGETLQTYAQNHFAGIGRHRVSSWLVATQRVVPCAAVVAYLVMGRPANYPMIAAAFAVPVLIAAATPLVSVAGAHGGFIGAACGSLGWWGLGLSNVLLQLQLPVLAVVSSTAVAGLFAMASKVIGPVLLLPVSMATVVVPELARRLHTGGAWDLYHKFSRVCLAYMGVALLCALPAGIVVTHVAGPRYAAALPLVAGMVAAAGLSAYSQAFTAMLVAGGRPNQATACIAGGAIVTLVLLAILGAWGPIESLAVVQVAAEVVVLPGMAISVRRLRAANVVP